VRAGTAVIGVAAESGSTCTPAALSLSSAPWAADVNSGDSHNWTATATAADSSWLRSMSGSSYALRLMR
jgi:hypothetical protein